MTQSEAASDRDATKPAVSFDLIEQWMEKAAVNCASTGRKEAAQLWNDALDWLRYQQAALAHRDAQMGSGEMVEAVADAMYKACRNGGRFDGWKEYRQEAKAAIEAIRYEGALWTLPAPKRHHDIIRLIHDELGHYEYGKSVQGFLSESGLFFPRRTAKFLAMQTGQILPGRGKSEELFSEDLW